VNLERITEPVKDERERSWRGFNFFARADASVLLAILRGEYQISGLRQPAFTTSAAREKRRADRAHLIDEL